MYGNTCVSKDINCKQNKLEGKKSNPLTENMIHDVKTHLAWNSRNKITEIKSKFFYFHTLSNTLIEIG